MTRSWEAFQHFKRGLDRWSEFALQTAERDPDALSHAIRHFRDAIGVDPGFALAYYRLGLALQQDGQPLGAAEALRTSLKANPGFVPAMVALASVPFEALLSKLVKSAGRELLKIAQKNPCHHGN